MFGAAKLKRRAKFRHVREISRGGVNTSLLSVEHAKGFLNVSHDDDDALIQTLIDSAWEEIEARTNIVLRPTSFETSFLLAGNEDAYSFTTGRGPVDLEEVGIDFEMWDEDRVKRTLVEDSDYEVLPGSLDLQVVVLSDAAKVKYRLGSENGELARLMWSGKDVSSLNSVKGLSTIRTAALHMVAGAYETRESEAFTSQAAQINPAVDRMLRPFTRVFSMDGV